MKELHASVVQRFRGGHGDHLRQAAGQHDGMTHGSGIGLPGGGDGFFDQALLHAGAHVADGELEDVFRFDRLRGRGAGAG